MGDLATTITNVDTHLVSGFEKLQGGLELYFEVVSIGFDPEPYLLDVDLLLAASSFLLVLILLVSPFTPIDDANNRRFCSWRNFNQI